MAKEPITTQTFLISDSVGQAEYAVDDQIDRYDIVQKSWYKKNQYTRNKRCDRLHVWHDLVLRISVFVWITVARNSPLPPLKSVANSSASQPCTPAR